MATSEKLAVLFTCIGRRVSLLESFRSAAKRLRVKAACYGTDATRLSPALALCDEGFLVKPVSHPDYLRQLLSIVRSRAIDVLVPTIDWELEVLAEHKAELARAGCFVLISQPEVVRTCQDKKKTYDFLTHSGFDTPLTMSIRQAQAKGAEIKFPCFLKQRDGSAAKSNAVARSPEELRFYAKRIPRCIVQEYVRGDEITCDVFVDFDMQVRCVVPRKRIEVRAGEVSKGQVVKDRRIMDRCAELVSKLNAGPGVITVQLFLTADQKIKFIEINPRFGGGVPLAIKAGADFPKWILQRLLGRKPNIAFDGFEDELIMLRYDGEVWVSKSDISRISQLK